MTHPRRKSRSGVIREWGRDSSRISSSVQAPSLDQAFHQPALAPEPPLDAGHLAVVTLVIIAKEM